MDNYERESPVKLPKWILIILVLSLVINATIYTNLRYMKEEIRNLRSTIYSIESSVNSSVSNSISRINHILEKDASLISDFKYELGDYKDKRVDVTLTVKPKTYTRGEEVHFLIKSGSQATQDIKTDSSDQIVFTASSNISIFDSVEIDLIIDDGTTKKVEKLPNIQPPVDELRAYINLNNRVGSYIYQNQAIKTTYEFEVYDASKGKEVQNNLSDVKLVVKVNDEIYEEKPMEKYTMDQYLDRYYIKLDNYIIPCKDNDVVSMLITAKDDGGLNYKYNAVKWTISNNRINYSHDDYGYNEFEVY